jgi:small glutamine-rich tetratricopeptide repeat-containing protein alpha
MIDFLNSSAKDGTIPADEADSIEVATTCIAEAFHVDPTDSAAVSDAIGTQNLLSIYSVFEKLKGKGGAASTPGATGGSSSASASSAQQQQQPGATQSKAADAAAAATPASKEQAETLKGQGNAAMQRRDYKAAIDLYSKALDLVPLNPIYLSNRAAAYSGDLQHDKAVEDAELAVAADPKYSKAWSRLGLARYALGDAKGSMDAYKKGIEAEGSGGSDAMKKGYETARKAVEELGEDVDDVPAAARSASPGAGPGGMPDLSALGNMFGGGGGGMPNLSELMNNPMMRQMAQNIMSNPDAMNNILNNPRLREMAERYGGAGSPGGAGGAGGAPGGGGGMPDLSSLMNDPSIAEM